jgi:hypothetical protein
MSDTLVLPQGSGAQAIAGRDPAPRELTGRAPTSGFAEVLEGSIVAAVHALPAATGLAAGAEAGSAIVVDSGKRLPSDAAVDTPGAAEEVMEEVEEPPFEWVVPALTMSTAAPPPPEPLSAWQDPALPKTRFGSGSGELVESALQEQIPSTRSLGQTDTAAVAALPWPARAQAGTTPPVSLPEVHGPVPGIAAARDGEGAGQVVFQGSPDASEPPQSGPVAKPASFKLELPVGAKGWGEDLTNRMLLLVNQRAQVAEVKLNPPHLGPMEIRVALDQDTTNISFTVQGTGVREAVEATLPRLRELLNEAGVSLLDVNVAERHANDGGARRESVSGDGADASESEAPPEDSVGTASGAPDSAESSRALLDAYV